MVMICGTCIGGDDDDDDDSGGGGGGDDDVNDLGDLWFIPLKLE